jgi:amino acid permease
MKTAKLLNISLILFAISMLAAFTWSALGFKNADRPFIAILLIICFALNVAGIFVALFEERKSKKAFLYGLIGNTILVLFYLAFFIFVLLSMK